MNTTLSHPTLAKLGDLMHLRDFTQHFLFFGSYIQYFTEKVFIKAQVNK